MHEKADCTISCFDHSRLELSIGCILVLIVYSLVHGLRENWYFMRKKFAIVSCEGTTLTPTPASATLLPTPFYYSLFQQLWIISMKRGKVKNETDPPGGGGGGRGSGNAQPFFRGEE